MQAYCVISWILSLYCICVHDISLQSTREAPLKDVSQIFSAHLLCSASILVTKGQLNGKKES